MATSANGGQPEACAFSNIFWYSWEKVLRYEELLFVQLVEINPRHLAAYMARINTGCYKIGFALL